MTFLDDNLESVDATCMVDIISESKETLYDTIAKSGVQVRLIVMCYMCDKWWFIALCMHA